MTFIDKPPTAQRSPYSELRSRCIIIIVGYDTQKKNKTVDFISWRVDFIPSM